MTIEVKVIADSISEFALSRMLKMPTSAEDFKANSPNTYSDGDRITTLELKYPRFIHSEFMTHRVFSRNASSSRAIPVERLIQDILDDTAMPVHWGKNQPGMQAREEHDAYVVLPGINDDIELSNKEAWLLARDQAIELARAYTKAGYHKQIVNRLLEPFAHIRVVVTSTQWDNFLELRDHPDAQPEIQELAQKIRVAMTESAPVRLHDNQWHIPYVTDEDIDALWTLARPSYGVTSVENVITQMLLKISVARCARVSYLTHDGKKPEIEKELELYNRLVGSVPLHASPAEHQAMYYKHLNEVSFGLIFGKNAKFGPSNFKGPWLQLRKVLENGFKL